MEQQQKIEDSQVQEEIENHPTDNQHQESLIQENNNSNAAIEIKTDIEIEEQQRQNNQLVEESVQNAVQRYDEQMQIEDDQNQDQQKQEVTDTKNSQYAEEDNNEQKANENNEGDNSVENKNNNNKQKSKRNSTFSVIQESNIIQGERLRTRNPSTSQSLQLQKNSSSQQNTSKPGGGSEQKSQKKSQQNNSEDLDALELLEIRKKQISKEVTGPSNSENYLSKTPDIILQIVDDIIKYDKIDCLRQQFCDSKIEEIPNLAKYGERKKKEDFTIKDQNGNLITIYYQDQIKLKKEEEEKKLQEQMLAKQAEQEKINKQQQISNQTKQLDYDLDKDNNMKLDEFSKDQFANLTPSKDIYFNNDSKRTPQKLLTEEIVLDDHHGIQMQAQTNVGTDFVIEDNNNHHDTALNNLINDELLRQLDEEYNTNKQQQASVDFANINQFDRQIDVQNIQGNNIQNQQIQENGFLEQNQCFSQNLGNMDGQNEINGENEKQLPEQSMIGSYLTELNEDTKYNLEHTTVTSIDRIRDRAINNVYFSFEEVDLDFKKLFIYALYKRCGSIESINYICNIIDNYNSVIQRRAAKSKTILTKIADLQKLFKLDLDNKFQVKTWPFIPTNHRTYECIKEYYPEPPSNKESIYETLRSEKKPVECSESCACMDLNSLGNFSLEQGTWNSECPNRRDRIECTHHDCKNSQGFHGRQKVLGVDVKETLCWGIDQYTKKNIYYILPENEKEEIKFRFIQCSLMKAANLLENDGWEMKKVCDFIIRNSESKKSRINHDESKPKIKYIFSNSDRKFAKILNKAIELKIDQEAFRIHPKGMGVICINRNGIDQNDLIIEYIGEIYRPYRWFERQDFIKKYMKDNNQQDVLPDFYNIMLELHKDEVKGIDILYVDPMQKGNYSSRLSHSCDPNCGTVATISKGYYNISMFALKSIEYGEELAFDYSAVTESKNEHKQSTCLCGTQKCRGKYIELNNNNQKEYNYILDKIHCFLKRNSDLLRSGSEPLTEDDMNLLEKYNLKQNVQKGCEKWLLKWISIILKSVGEEQELFFSDQLISNRFIQQNDKDISLIQKAIEIKEKGGFEVIEAEENLLKQQELQQDQNQIQEQNSIQKYDPSNDKLNQDLQKQQSESIIKEEGDLSNVQEEKIEEEKSQLNDQIEQKIEEEIQNNDDQIDKTKEQVKLQIDNEFAQNKDSNILQKESSKMEPEEGEENNDDEEASLELKDSERKLDQPNKEEGEDVNENSENKTENNKEEEGSNNKISSETRIKSQSVTSNKKKSNNKKQKPKKQVKVRYTQEEIEKLEEKQKIKDLVEKNTIEQLNEKLVQKQNEKQKNIAYLQYLSNVKVENRIQNIIISLDKVKFYLNNVKDIRPPLSYLSQKEIFENLWGRVNKFQKRRKPENQVYSIVEELMDLIKYYSHYKECQYTQKFIELFDPFMTKYVEESYEKALLAWRLFCLNIHSVFNDIIDPQFHAGALLIVLYFYAFTHTYFTPHEYQPFNSEKMTISETEMFNLELLDEDKKNTKKPNKKKNYEEQRSYSSQFIWGQLTVWFKQTVASPQATLSQDRRGTLSYPQLNQSFKTNILTYPFQEKNDKTGRQTFLNHMKEKPKDMWPPEQAKWSFKNALKNYGTLLFEGVHSQKLFENLIEKVIELIDGSFEEKLKLFIQVENKLSQQTEQDIQEIQTECFDVIKQQLTVMNFQTVEKTLEQLKQDQLLIQQQSNLVDPDSKMQLRTVRKKQKDQEDDDFFYGDILKKKPQQPVNQQNSTKQKDVSTNSNSNKQQEEIKETQISHTTSELKKRKFNEYILNDEDECYIEEDESIEDIIKESSNLSKYLVIEVKKSLITNQLPKIAIKMKKEYPDLLAPPTKKDHRVTNKISEKDSKKNQSTYQHQNSDKKQKNNLPQQQNKSQHPPSSIKIQHTQQETKTTQQKQNKSTQQKFQHQSLLSFSSSKEKQASKQEVSPNKTTTQKPKQKLIPTQNNSDKSKQKGEHQIHQEQTKHSQQGKTQSNSQKDNQQISHSHPKQKQDEIENVSEKTEKEKETSKIQPKKKTPSKSNSSGQGEKGQAANQQIDEIEALSAYRYHNEDSRKSVLSQASQNSQDSNQRRSHRAKTQFDYNLLFSKKAKPQQPQNNQQQGHHTQESHVTNSEEQQKHIKNQNNGNSQNEEQQNHLSQQIEQE
ncbi:SET domain protein (macronuclear) [Tetrahymena thermophila SB210]|uniref:SET domain protein n=1 Tax=Tetrahymena thermophila (strain SB210) TaxID=312017 RepID=I7M6H1_TETTS|nr:SET domain protein [Tetrahymena thermophila SB210]EAR85193.3 SET domain protein [Tetrahymena thermophila SB210]|eukprot:XP_001032856.3 SET domain protein [Tetrahymena thermophila SB210]